MKITEKQLRDAGSDNPRKDLRTYRRLLGPYTEKKLSRLATRLTGRRDVKVKITEKDKSFAGPFSNQIRIEVSLPAFYAVNEDYESIYLRMEGVLAHECGHVSFSDFSLMGQIQSDKESAAKEVPVYAEHLDVNNKEQCEILHDLIKEMLKKHFEASLFNSLEDAAIESLMYESHTETYGPLIATREYIYEKEKQVLMQYVNDLRSRHWDIDDRYLLQSLITEIRMMAVIGYRKQISTELLDQFFTKKEIEDLFWNARVARLQAKTSKARLTVTRVILDQLDPFIERMAQRFTAAYIQGVLNAKNQGVPRLNEIEDIDAELAININVDPSLASMCPPPNIHSDFELDAPQDTQEKINEKLKEEQEKSQNKNSGKNGSESSSTEEDSEQSSSESSNDEGEMNNSSETSDNESKTDNNESSGSQSEGNSESSSESQNQDADTDNKESSSDEGTMSDESNSEDGETTNTERSKSNELESTDQDSEQSGSEGDSDSNSESEGTSESEETDSSSQSEKSEYGQNDESSGSADSEKTAGNDSKDGSHEGEDAVSKSESETDEKEPEDCDSKQEQTDDPWKDFYGSKEMKEEIEQQAKKAERAARESLNDIKKQIKIEEDKELEQAINSSIHGSCSKRAALKSVADISPISDLHEGATISIIRSEKIKKRSMTEAGELAKSQQGELKKNAIKWAKPMKQLLMYQSNSSIRKGLSTGDLNRTGLYRARTDLKIFKKKTVGKEKKARFCTLIDCSGSMYGPKMVNAIKAAYMLGEACKSVQVPISIYGHTTEFSNEVILYECVSYEDNRDRQCFETLFNLCAEKGNRDGLAMFQCMTEMVRASKKDEILIFLVISDGWPTYGNATTEEAAVDMQVIMEKFEKNYNVKTIGVGIGEECDCVQEIYKNALIVQDVEQLGNELLKILKNEILD